MAAAPSQGSGESPRESPAIDVEVLGSGERGSTSQPPVDEALLLRLLRRALRASSIRMPVLVEELRQLHDRQGLLGLAERLCGIEQLWQGEERGSLDDLADGSADLSDSLGQLDLLLQEIRQSG